MKLGHTTSGSDYSTRPRRQILDNIGENENLDSYLLPDKVNQKKKLRRKARDIIKKPNQKIQILRTDSHDADEASRRKIDVVLVEEEENVAKTKCRCSNNGRITLSK